MHDFDGTDSGRYNFGRKGISYDWQSLYAAAQVATLDRELAGLIPEHAE